MANDCASYFIPMPDALLERFRGLVPSSEGLWSRFIDLLNEIAAEDSQALPSPDFRYVASRNGWQQESLVEHSRNLGVDGLRFVTEALTCFSSGEVGSAFEALRQYMMRSAEPPASDWEPPKERPEQGFDDQTPNSYFAFIDCMGQAMKEAMAKGFGFVYLYEFEG
jgi:hypothetical protein